jgi:hypothetical protein
MLLNLCVLIIKVIGVNIRMHDKHLKIQLFYFIHFELSPMPLITLFTKKLQITFVVSNFVNLGLHGHKLRVDIMFLTTYSVSNHVPFLGFFCGNICKSTNLFEITLYKHGEWIFMIWIQIFAINFIFEITYNTWGYTNK